MFKFIHAADLHLDSPRAGLDRDSDAPADEIRLAPRQALSNLVLLAIEQQVALVVIAGDVFDGDGKDFDSTLFFNSQLQKLADAQIPTFFIAGNHDAENKMTKKLPLPKSFVTKFAANKPGTETIEELDVAIHGQSFANAAVTDNLAQDYPNAVSGKFNIGILHTSATSSGGVHERYAPCSLEDLGNKQYDYWALGHIHKRQNLHKEGDTPIVYPGNIQGRDVGETGPKGCVLVTVDDNKITDVSFQPLDVMRWYVCDVDASDCDSADQVVERATSQLQDLASENDNLPLAIRIEIRGACAAHRQLTAEPERWLNEFKNAALGVSGSEIWIEKVKRRTSPPVEHQATGDIEGPLGAIDDFLNSITDDSMQLTEIAEELRVLSGKLPVPLREGKESLDLTSIESIPQLLADARELIAFRMQQDQAGQ